MSPFLEIWYPQTECTHCGTAICFLEDELGRMIPTESDGTDHRTRCKPQIDWSKIPKCKECGVRLEPGREYCAICEAQRKRNKPKWPRAAITHEKAHEGQQELSRWCR